MPRLPSPTGLADSEAEVPRRPRRAQYSHAEITKNIPQKLQHLENRPPGRSGVHYSSHISHSATIIGNRATRIARNRLPRTNPHDRGKQKPALQIDAVTWNASTTSLMLPVLLLVVSVSIKKDNRHPSPVGGPESDGVTILCAGTYATQFPLSQGRTEAA